MTPSDLPRPVSILGLAGLAPQTACLALAFADGTYRWISLAAGCFYAATILSFLGGMWWMSGLLTGVRQSWIYVVAVMPSLFGWASLLPLVFGWRWPGPSLFALGLALLVSPLLDLRIARKTKLSSEWLVLRMILATGLGFLTFALAAVST